VRAQLQQICFKSILIKHEINYDGLLQQGTSTQWRRPGMRDICPLAERF